MANKLINLNKDTFMYFGYGSNLLTKRIHIQNPTAVRRHIGQLKDHRLDFIGSSQKWGGASATIVPHLNENVWGVIWEINKSNLADLDNQEGVSDNIYIPKTVDIHLPNGEIVECRVYQRTLVPANDAPYPAEKPSLLYLNTIIYGAIESNMPEFYIGKLKAIPHNGYYDEEMGKELGILPHFD